MKRVVMSVASIALAAGATVATTAPAQAQVQQDGLVNVNVGDVTILEDVNIGVAANVVANVCGVTVGPVAVLGRAVDRSGQTETVCTSGTDPVTITQN
jgi:glycerol-3-phosphate dehydrogenase